ncbi:major facilitator superfamily transporter [Phlyctema vagabunda]|uniref:Major facilitator superfamily transporter n=1 Tax=Phlyctema vagabunda TaxID=108571 RepID=A0ABR4P545_9HELO
MRDLSTFKPSIHPEKIQQVNDGFVPEDGLSENPCPAEHARQFRENTELERRITLKCDLKLLPPLMVLFIITFIDRTNIANAKIEGMITELRMKNTDYNTALWILNIPYICLALPSNMLMKKGFVKPSVYLSGQMFCWSLCTIGLGLTRSFKGILICRFLMGCFEAGFVPGKSSLLIRSRVSSVGLNKYQGVRTSLVGITEEGTSRFDMLCFSALLSWQAALEV